MVKLYIFITIDTSRVCATFSAWPQNPIYIYFGNGLVFNHFGAKLDIFKYKTEHTR